VLQLAACSSFDPIIYPYLLRIDQAFDLSPAELSDISDNETIQAVW